MKYSTKKAFYLGGRRYMPGDEIELDDKQARRVKHLLVTNSNSMPEKATKKPSKKEEKAPEPEASPEKEEAEAEEKAVEGKSDKQVKKATKK